VIVEDGALARLREATPRAAVELELLRDAGGVLRRVLVDVDLAQLVASHALGPVTECGEPLDLIAFEEDCLAHRSTGYPCRRALPRRTACPCAGPDRLSAVRSVRSIPRCGRRVLRQRAAASPPNA
jgi:hypothetical protein